MKNASILTLSALRTAIPCTVLMTLSVAIVDGADLKKTSVPAQAITASAGIAKTGKMQHFRLADGRELEAAIVGYSPQSRVITMRMPSGHTSHISPRDLTAMSKLKWLTSPAFYDAVRQLRLPDGWLWALADNLLLPTLAVAGIGLFCFWGGVSAISGQRGLGRAAKTYGKMLGLIVLLMAVSIAAQYALAELLPNVSFLPMIRSAILVGGFSLAFITAFNQIGEGYGLSAAPQFGVVIATGGIAFTLATALLYVLPRVLQRPGLDDWFTDRLLSPLGLA